jgi:hypothetical protein
MRFANDRLGPFLQAIVIEAERRVVATDPTRFRQPDRRFPERLRNPVADLPLPPPRRGPGTPAHRPGGNCLR